MLVFFKKKIRNLKNSNNVMPQNYFFNLKQKIND